MLTKALATTQSFISTRIGYYTLCVLMTALAFPLFFPHFWESAMSFARVVYTTACAMLAILLLCATYAYRGEDKVYGDICIGAALTATAVCLVSAIGVGMGF